MEDEHNDKLAEHFNPMAFLFGPFYYIGYGKTLKGVAFLIPSVIYGLLSGQMEPPVKILAGMVIGAVIAIYCGIRANEVRIPGGNYH